MYATVAGDVLATRLPVDVTEAELMRRYDVTRAELQRLLGPQNAPLKVRAAMARTGDAGGRDR